MADKKSGYKDTKVQDFIKLPPQDIFGDNKDDKKAKVPKKEIETARESLYKFYRTIHYSGDLDTKVNDIIEKALTSWTGAPSDFMGRVRQLIGYRTISKWVSDNLNTIKSEDSDDYFTIKDPLFKGMASLKIEEVPINDIYNTEKTVYIKDTNSIVDYLKKDEKSYWLKRQSQYEQEFDFNDSSDRILLEQLLYTELLLRRLKLKNLNPDYNVDVKNLKESSLLDEHKKLLEKLGVLRVQRIQLDQNIQGNVSQLSVILDDKLRDLRSLYSKSPKKYKESLLKLKKEYDILTKDELRDILEERELLKEAELYGEINPISQSVLKVIENNVEKLENADLLGDD